MNNDNYQPFTVTMTATHFVYAESRAEAECIVSEALLKLHQVDARIPDTETHWAEGMTLSGHYSTIVRDDDEMSDYDARLLELNNDNKETNNA